ncbi:transglycosylase domain-containing protein [Thermoactinospora rubra]|uniref:transglycosylase domain-containing protein n=1 Tax=Thermoactinospora rubra TaxID=1088767 RepID=UPI001F0B30FD|nr:transglycosylase domain-containing protein [Thermoactinospora rubra]
MRLPKRRVVRWSLIIAGAGLIAAIGLFAMAWAMTPIPDSSKKEATAQGSVIYYRDGKTVLARQGVNRKNVPLSAVPGHVRAAVIAAENRSFYSDSGVSVRGTARALWSTLTGHQLQGGSTITQQMVRNYYSGLSQERSVVRKIKEILIALKVDQSKSKDWVLEQYLNTIYFGRGANGVQAAAQAYFGKDVGELTVAEGAYLAAVIQQPSRFADPRGAGLQAARDRWKSVVDAMVQIGALSPEEAARQAFPALAKPKKPFGLKGQAQYMVDQVRAELNRRGYSDEAINGGGLKIVTTFDKSLMAAAERAVKAVLPEDTPKQVRAGLAAVDPATGEVVAFYGGREKVSQYDNAFSAKVQAGSTFKAYTLAAALDDGFELSSRADGNSPMRVASKPIKNSGGVSYGHVDLVTAMQHSVNTAFVDLGRQVGLDKVVKVAEAAGIPAGQLEPHAKAATLPLGVASVSAVQNASGFGAFANGGVHVEAHVVKSVTGADGRKNVVAPVSTTVVSKQAAADTTYALQQVVRGGTGTAARLWDRPVAGKTGTTDGSAAAWFVGYTPQLSTAVNLFRDDNETVVVGGSAQYGGQLPAQIWRAFMTEAMEGEPVVEFPEPSDYGYSYDYDPVEEEPRQEEEPQDWEDFAEDFGPEEGLPEVTETTPITPPTEQPETTGEPEQSQEVVRPTEPPSTEADSPEPTR